MAHHVIVEFNLDFSHVFKDDPRFPENLYLALAHRHINNERILNNYGIKVINEHHSSDCKQIVNAQAAALELLEACKDFVFLEKTNMTKKQVQLQIEITKEIIAKAEEKEPP